MPILHILAGERLQIGVQEGNLRDRNGLGALGGSGLEGCIATCCRGEDNRLKCVRIHEFSTMEKHLLLVQPVVDLSK